MDVNRAVLPEICSLKSQLFPVIYHEYIYYLSSSSAREKFMTNPGRYLAQTPPGPQVPVRLAIVGPPKSGKSEGSCIIATHVVQGKCRAIVGLFPVLCLNI